MNENDYLADMYQDEYYPNFLVDKIKLILKNIVLVLDKGETDLEIIQSEFDKATISINKLEDEFEENDSELETGVRESIWENVLLIIEKYNVELDVEDAIRERNW